MIDEMATNLPSCNHVEEDYIDMEVSSPSNLFCSSPQTRDFEFKMCNNNSISLEKEATTSPADELFYKGNLLPLHLPPRLQMVQKLLQNSITPSIQEDENYSIVPSTNNSTPLDQSCNISPSESCRLSSELNADDCFFEWSTELSGFINGDDHPKKSCPKKKLKMMIKQSSIGRKLKASRAYLKSLFSKSGCSDESCAKAACHAQENGHGGSKGNYLSKYIKVTRKGPSGQTRKENTFPTLATLMNEIEKEGFDQDNVSCFHRKSFSGAIKRRPKMKCSSSSSSCASSSSSSSFSFNSNGLYEFQVLKRSSSATSEIDGSIEAAIAHCKKSQQLFTSRNTVNEAGFCSFSLSKIAA